MKTVGFLLTILLALPAFADRVNNGGGLWGCVGSDTRLRRAMLVDLFEAENEFGLDVIKSASGLAPEIAKYQIDLLTAANAGLGNGFLRSLETVLKKIRPVNGILTFVDDALYRLSPHPDQCSPGKWEYLQFANYTQQDQVLIRDDLWKSTLVSEIDRAALLTHEAVYLWLRKEKKDQDSVRARQIVGILFSTLPASEKNTEILNVLNQQDDDPLLKAWACTVDNTHESSTFIGFGNLMIEAQSAALETCKSNSGNGFFCSGSTSCEEAKTSAEIWFCQVDNTHESKTFSGKGRTKVEAQYGAKKACQSGSNGFFCQPPSCQSKP